MIQIRSAPVAEGRRLIKLLLFAGLVLLPSNGTVSRGRDSGQPCDRAQIMYSMK